MDKGALSDSPAWAEDTDNELLSSGEEEGTPRLPDPRVRGRDRQAAGRTPRRCP